MRAWYKPGHEPALSIGRADTAEDYSNGLKRLDLHDLKLLRSFWYGEKKLLENGQPLASDLEVTNAKLARLNAEIQRRKANDDF